MIKGHLFEFSVVLMIWEENACLGLERINNASDYIFWS